MPHSVPTVVLHQNDMAPIWQQSFPFFKSCHKIRSNIHPEIQTCMTNSFTDQWISSSTHSSMKPLTRLCEWTSTSTARHVRFDTFHFWMPAIILQFSPLGHEHPLLHTALHGNCMHSAKKWYYDIQTLYHIVDFHFWTRLSTQCLHNKCVWIPIHIPHLMVIFTSTCHMLSNAHTPFLLFTHLWPSKEKQLP